MMNSVSISVSSSTVVKAALWTIHSFHSIHFTYVMLATHLKIVSARAQFYYLLWLQLREHPLYGVLTVPDPSVLSIAIVQETRGSCYELLKCLGLLQSPSRGKHVKMVSCLRKSAM